MRECGTLHVEPPNAEDQVSWAVLERNNLLARVNKAAAALKSHFGARRVILFGSLVEVERFRADSDVDLAVEGLDPFDRWDAWWLCEELIEDREVDLVPVELAEASVRKAIEHSGKEL